MMLSLCLIKRHSEDYIIIPKEEFYPKQYRTKVPVPKMKEPNYWYLDQMKEVNCRMISGSIRDGFVFVKYSFHPLILPLLNFD